MRIEKECPCCGAVYKVSFVQPERDQEDWDVQDETFEDESEELYPEFCPFCGCHEDDDPPPEEEDETG